MGGVGVLGPSGPSQISSLGCSSVVMYREASCTARWGGSHRAEPGDPEADCGVTTRRGQVGRQGCKGILLELHVGQAQAGATVILRRFVGLRYS